MNPPLDLYLTMPVLQRLNFSTPPKARTALARMAGPSSPASMGVGRGLSGSWAVGPGPVCPQPARHPSSTTPARLRDRIGMEVLRQEAVRAQTSTGNLACFPRRQLFQATAPDHSSACM